MVAPADLERQAPPPVPPAPPVQQQPQLNMGFAFDSAQREIEALKRLQERNAKSCEQCLWGILGLIGLISGLFLIGFGTQGIIRYSNVEMVICNTTQIIDTEITARFSFGGVVSTDTIVIDDIELQEEYIVGTSFVCWWYPHARELAIYGNLLGHKIVMFVMGFLALGNVNYIINNKSTSEKK